MGKSTHVASIISGSLSNPYGIWLAPHDLDAGVPFQLVVASRGRRGDLMKMIQIGV